MTVIWCMVPEIWSTTGYLFTQVYQKSWSYAILFLGYSAWWDVIVTFYFGLFFALLPPTSLSHPLLKNRKIKISKKWKKYLEISSFYTSVPKIMILCYSSTLRRKFLHFSIKKLFTFFIRSILKTLIVESIFAWVEILLHEI